MYHIKAVKKIKIHLMPNTLLLCKYKDTERICQSQQNVFIINIWEFFYKMFQSEGTIVVVNDILFLYICYYNHNGMNQLKMYCKSLVFEIIKQNKFLCCHLTPQELLDKFWSC
jgi:hypothetical protein